MRIGGFTITVIAFVAIATRAEATSLVVSRTDGARDCPDATSLAERTGSAGARRPYTAAPHPSASGIEVSFDGEGDARSAVIIAAGGKRRTFTEKASTCDGLAEAVVLALVLTADGPDDEPPPAAPPEEPPPPVTPPPRRIAARIDGGATSAFGTVRDAAFGAQIGVHVGPHDGWWTLGAMGTWLPSSTLALRDGSAEVAYLGGGLEACFSRALARIVDLEACVRAEAGSLSGQARGFATNENHARPLFAGGAFLRGILSVASPLALFVEGGVRAPIHRENFAVEGAGTVYDAPAVGGIGRGGRRPVDSVMGSAMSTHSLPTAMSPALVQPLVTPLPSAAANLRFEDVYRESVTFVWRSLRRLGVREADVEDAVQDVFVVVHGKLDGFEGRSRLSTWLYGICFRVAHARRRRAHVRHEVPEEAAGPMEDIAAPPEGAALRNEQLTLLEEALDALPLDQRAVFTLFELDGMTCQDIGVLVDAPLGTVYSRLRLGREAFRRAAVRLQARAEAGRAL